MNSREVPIHHDRRTAPSAFPDLLARGAARLYLAKMDPVTVIERHKHRLMLLDYKDAKRVSTPFRDQIFDLGDGEIDFPACHRVLKSIQFMGWLCVELDTAHKGPRASYERCAAYVVEKLESIYV